MNPEKTESPVILTTERHSPIRVHGSSHCCGRLREIFNDRRNRFNPGDSEPHRSEESGAEGKPRSGFAVLLAHVSAITALIVLSVVQFPKPRPTWTAPCFWNPSHLHAAFRHGWRRRGGARSLPPGIRGILPELQTNSVPPTAVIMNMSPS